MKEFIAGAIAGGVGLSIGHPLDTIKTKMQIANAQPSNNSTISVMRDIFNSGLKNGFFRGMSFPLVSFGAINSILFGVQSNTIQFLDINFLSMSANSKMFLAGATGGLFTSILFIPIDNVKVVLQSQISANRMHKDVYFKGPVECSYSLYKSNGLRGLYKGGILTMTRLAPGFGLYFLIYDNLNKYFIQSKLFDKQMSSLLAGGTGGSLTWLAIMPLDVVKSHMQADIDGKIYKNTMTCIKTIYKASGIKGFFTGIVITCIRAFPTNAAIFFTYEKSLQLLKNL